MTAFIYEARFGAKEEPYRDGEEREPESGRDEIEIEVNLGLHWCEKCEAVSDMWIEDPTGMCFGCGILRARIAKLEGGIMEAIEKVGQLWWEGRIDMKSAGELKKELRGLLEVKK